MTKIDGVFLMSFALVLKKMSWYRRRYSRPLRVLSEGAITHCIRIYVMHALAISK